jgi:hypothetical protein
MGRTIGRSQVTVRILKRTDERLLEVVRGHFDALGDDPTLLSSLIPLANETIARVFNPARLANTSESLPWRRLVPNPSASMQWSPDLASRHPELDEPKTGDLEPEMAMALAALLAQSTNVAPTCTFAIWPGYAEITLPSDAAVYEIPNYRSFAFVRGALDQLPEIARTIGRYPLRWWPDDASWCVANDIYARSLYVGADEATIAAMLDDARLEAYAVTPGHRIEPEDLL